MDWYDTAGDSWLDSAFGDVNVDSYHDVVAPVDPFWFENAVIATDPELTTAEVTAGTPQSTAVDPVAPPPAAAPGDEIPGDAVRNLSCPW